MTRSFLWTGVRLAALCSLLLLAACGGKDRFDAGKVEEGGCYQLTGIAPDAVAMRVDGIDVPMDMYFYNLCYAASYMESYMNMYGMDLDWSMELQEGETVLDVTKDSILENTKSFAVIEKLAQENNVILDEAALSELETERAETVESLGGEESYRAELAKLGLSEETYDRMCRSDYLYSALEELAATEGSSLYATDEQLIAYAAEQGYMTADHILLLTRDMSTYQELDDETKAEKKALAEELKAKLDAYTGDDLIGYFTELADEYSEDSGRAGNPEGYTFGSGQMVEEFESAAAALGEGEVSEIVESYYGYHIILRLPLDPDGKTLSQDSGTGDYMTLRADAANELFNAMLIGWIESAEVEWKDDFGSLDYNELFTIPEGDTAADDTAAPESAGSSRVWMYIAIAAIVVVIALAAVLLGKKKSAETEETETSETAEVTTDETEKAETVEKTETEDVPETETEKAATETEKAATETEAPAEAEPEAGEQSEKTDDQQDGRALMMDKKTGMSISVPVRKLSEPKRESTLSPEAEAKFREAWNNVKNRIYSDQETKKEEDE